MWSCLTRKFIVLIAATVHNEKKNSYNQYISLLMLFTITIPNNFRWQNKPRKRKKKNRLKFRSSSPPPVQNRRPFPFSLEKFQMRDCQRSPSFHLLFLIRRVMFFSYNKFLPAVLSWIHGAKFSHCLLALLEYTLKFLVFGPQFLSYVSPHT